MLGRSHMLRTFCQPKLSAGCAASPVKRCNIALYIACDCRDPVMSPVEGAETTRNPRSLFALDGPIAVLAVKAIPLLFSMGK